MQKYKAKRKESQINDLKCKKMSLQLKTDKLLTRDFNPPE